MNLNPFFFINFLFVFNPINSMRPLLRVHPPIINIALLRQWRKGLVHSLLFPVLEFFPVCAKNWRNSKRCTVYLNVRKYNYRETGKQMFTFRVTFEVRIYSQIYPSSSSLVLFLFPFIYIIIYTKAAVDVLITHTHTHTSHQKQSRCAKSRSRRRPPTLPASPITMRQRWRKRSTKRADAVRSGQQI